MKKMINNLLREPLVHFLFIGAGLFFLFGLKSGPAPQPGGQSGLQSTKIVVTQSGIDQMIATFTRTWQRRPSEAEIKGLIENFVRDEIYYREALAIGLDRDDTVIRRRMRQKMEFIFEDITAQAEATDKDLLAFMTKHFDLYAVDPQISFHHVYINADRRGKNTEADAQQILAQLKQGVDPATVGDRFLMEQDNRLLPLWNIQKQFGEEFSKNLLALKPERWQGPIRSEFGLHLVFVRERVDGRLPELNEVREMVKRDWEAERRKELKDAAYAKFKERYTVEFEQPNAEVSTAIAEAGTRTVTR